MSENKAPRGVPTAKIEIDRPNQNPIRSFKGNRGEGAAPACACARASAPVPIPTAAPAASFVPLPGGRVGRLVPADEAGEFAIRVVEGGVTLAEQGTLDALATLWEETGLRRPGVTPWANPAGGTGAFTRDLPLRSRPLRTWLGLMRTLGHAERLAAVAYAVDGEVRAVLVRALPAIERYLRG